MDKNTITGLVLIALVLIGYGYCSNKRAVDAGKAKTEQVESKKDNNKAVATHQPAKDNVATAVDSTAPFYNCAVDPEHAAATAKYVTIENSKLRVEINPIGGEVANVYLVERKEGTDEYRYKSYQDFNEKKNAPLHLYRAQDTHLGFTIDTKEGQLVTGNHLFSVVSQNRESVTLRMASADGKAHLDFVYALQPDNYMLDFTIESQGMDRYVSANTRVVNVDWSERVSQLEKGFTFENDHSSLTYKLNGDDTEMLSERESEKETEFDGDVTWVAFKNQYFSSVLIADVPLKMQSVESTVLKKGNKEGHLKAYNAQMQAAYDPTGKAPTKLQFYFGPNHFRLLQSMDQHAIGGERDLEMEELVYLGWPLFKWINRFFTLYVFDFLTRLGLPMGIVLLLITILLRFIVYIPTRKSFMSSAKMRVLKPKIDELSKQYPNKDDAMKKQQAMMTLYSQYGVSPMGGCLPMLIQMPIWIAMFNFVPNAIELRQEGFLWAEDLSTYDSLISWNHHIWGIGDHLSLFCLLFCATNILYSFMTMRQQRESMSSEQAQQMKLMQWMMYLMPVFFFFMFNDYSSGLNYYYFISLLASALTMWYLRRTTDDAKLLAKLEENFRANKNNPNKKPTGLAARLEALQKQQEAMMKAQQQRKK